MIRAHINNLDDIFDNEDNLKAGSFHQADPDLVTTMQSYQFNHTSYAKKYTGYDY